MTLQKLIFVSTLLLLYNAIQAQEEIGAPYNPDVNADSLINLPDMLSILPLYGQPFIVSDDDLDNENEIQSLYLSGDTLYLVPNGGYVLLEDLAPEFNYDSLATTLSIDSTFMANVGGLGGSCSYEFPQSRFGQNIAFDLSTQDYIVPSGKNLYITHVYLELGEELTINNQPVVEGGYGSFPECSIIAKSGDIISQNGNFGSFSGFIVDEQDEITPLLENQSFNYQVPTGKNLVILRMFMEDGWELKLDGTSVIKNNNQSTVQFPRPLVVDAGTVLSMNNVNNTVQFLGYLVDEDYFADCGGGSSGDTESNSDGTIIYDIECVDFGVSPGCPSAILLNNQNCWQSDNDDDEVEIDPIFFENGCADEIEDPHWRKFRVSGNGLGWIEHFIIAFGSDELAGGRVLNNTGSSFEIFIWIEDGVQLTKPTEMTEYGVGLDYNWSNYNEDWLFDLTFYSNSSFKIFNSPFPLLLQW